jgi:large subunit ribosomal protein L25
MSSLLNAAERRCKAKKARRMGFIPGNIYGPEISHNEIVQFEWKEINKFLKNYFTGSKARVKFKDSEMPCVIKNIQYEPINNGIPIHIDLYISPEDKPVKVEVPLIFKGRELLAKDNLILNTLKDNIEIKGLLKDLPGSIEVDVSRMNSDSMIITGDIDLPDGIELLSEEDEVIARVSDADVGEPEDKPESDN